MSNGYGVLGYEVLETFLSGTASYNQSEKKAIVHEDEPPQCSPKPR